MLLGVDPEMFVFDPIKRKTLPAHLFFPLKGARIHAEDFRGSFYRDGYAVEFNLDRGEFCRENLTTQLYGTIHYASMFLRKHKLKLITAPAVRIDLKSLIDAPSDVQQFGCSPSINAYSREEEVPRIDGMSHNLRYAGGHLHFGTTVSPLASSLQWMQDPDSVFLFVKMCDLYIGVPLTYVEASPLNYLRRLHYGKAGDFRFQKYERNTIGIEYRSLSPFWLRRPELLSFALGTGRYIAYHFEQVRRTWNHKLEESIQIAINTGKGLRGLLRDPLVLKDDEDCSINVKRNVFVQLAKKRTPERNWLTLVHGTDVGWYRWCNKYYSS